MGRRIISAIVLAVLGVIGSGSFPAYADAHPTHAKAHPAHAEAHPAHADTLHATTAAVINGTSTNTATTAAVTNGTSTDTASNTLVTGNTATATIDTLDVAYSPYHLAITSVGNPTIREGEKLHVEARFVNESASSLTLGAELLVHKKGFATRSHLLAFINDGWPFNYGEDVSKDVSDQLVSVAKSSKPITVAANSEQTFALEADADTLKELGWSAQNWGPRGIEVRVSSPNTTAYNRTLVVVEPNEGIKPVPTGVAVALTDSLSELNDLYIADDLAQIRNQPTARQENLAALMSMKGVSIFADPAYAHLSKAPQTITTASANADVLTLLGLERTDLARSVTSEAFKNGDAPVRVTTLEYAKSIDDYAQLGASAFILDSAWCNMKQKNYATPATHTLLDGGNTSDGLDVLLNDAESVRVIANTYSSLHARQNALALSAMTYLEQPSIIRPQLLYFDFADGDEMWKMDEEGKVERDYSPLAEATSALMNAPWVQAAQISDLLDTPATGSVTVSADAIKSHFSLLDEKDLNSIDKDVEQASIPAHLTSDHATVLAPVTIAATHLYSQNWQIESNDHLQALTNFSLLAGKYSKSVSAVSVSTINLLAEQADIPVRVQNTLSVPATVSVELDSTDARLTAKNTVTVELPPASTTSVAIPVEAKGSGNVQAKIRLHDTGGTEVGKPATVTVRVRAGWENAATAVVAVLVALMLVVGIIRSIKGGRRSKPIAPSDYTQARRNRDLALADSSKKREVSPHDEA